MSGQWFFGLPPKALKHNFSMELFQQRYCQSGTPLAPLGLGMRCPDFSDWTFEIDPEVFERAIAGELGDAPGRGRGVLDLQETALICCPEDHECVRGCPARTRGRQRGARVPAVDGLSAAADASARRRWGAAGRGSARRRSPLGVRAVDASGVHRQRSATSRPQWAARALAAA